MFKPKISLLLPLFLNFLIAPRSFLAAEESLTITTYYPAPHGVYNELQTNKMAVGDTDGSGTLDSPDQPSANGQLYVARGVIYKPQTSLPDSDNVEGEVVYYDSDSQLYVYKGATDGWQTIAEGSCPDGFTDTGYGYCIQTNENSAKTWYAASDYCADPYNARLCTSSEWYNACVYDKASGMTGNYEWVDSWDSGSAYAPATLALVRGYSSCGSVGYAGAASDSHAFRCCRSK
ncbi:MAG: hypothetical protein WC559_05080 [Candidatus Omnitrophota bacterium]